MKNIFIKIKKTQFWYYFLLYIFIPFFNFIWTNLINFKGKIVFFKFKRKYKVLSKNLLNFKNNDKKIIRNSENLKELSKLINFHLNEKFLDEMRFKINEKKFKDDHYLHYKPNFQIDMFPFLKEDVKFKIIQFIINQKLIHEVSNYLNIMPVIGKLSLNLNVPVSNSSERGSMLWHKDDFGFRTVDFFIPIRDLTMDNGPLFFQKNKSSLGVLHKYSNIKQNPKRGERNKIEIDEFQKKVSDEDIEIFTGKPGDALMIDSFSCYHRGGFCEKGERIMLRVSYHTPDSIDMKDKINDKNAFRYCKLIKKDSFDFENFQKHLLFYRPNLIYRFKIPEIIISTFKIFHFKE